MILKKGEGFFKQEKNLMKTKVGRRKRKGQFDRSKEYV